MAIWLTKKFYEAIKFFIFENPLLMVKKNYNGKPHSKINVMINTK